MFKIPNRLEAISDRVAEYSLYIMVFFIPISIAALESFFGLALVSFAFKKAIRPDFSFLKSRTHLFLLLFFLFNAVSALLSGPFFAKSLEALIFKWTEYILIFLIAEDTLCNRQRIRNFAVIFLFSAFLIGIDGIFQRFSGMDFLRHRVLFVIEGKLPSISASFSHYNSLGAYLTVALPLAVSLMFYSGLKRIFKSGLIIETALLGTCLLMTSSRGSWLGFTSALFFMLFLRSNGRRLLVLFAIFVAAITLIQGLRERAILTFQPRGDADRLIMWETALRIIKGTPFFGKGVGTFMDYFHKYTPELYVQYAHNCFLQLWAETGIFGLLSFLLFIGSILTKSAKLAMRTGDALLLGVAGGIFGFLAHSFFDTNLYGVQLSVLFWMTAGIAMSIVNLHQKPPAR
ncbi:MAG: O-antigen ligase family protein [Candidatus Omnitrophota bacterium]